MNFTSVKIGEGLSIAVEIIEQNGDMMLVKTIDSRLPVSVYMTVPAINA